MNMLSTGTLAARLMATATPASAQDVGQTRPTETPPVASDAAIGDELRVSSVEVFQDRSPSPQRGSVVVVRYFMGDVQKVVSNPNGPETTMPTMVSPDGEVFEAVPRAENGPVADSVGQALSPQTAVFQIPLYAAEVSDDWRFQVGTFGTGVQIVLQ